MSIVHRVGGSPLTNQQVDDNFDYVEGLGNAALARAGGASEFWSAAGIGAHSHTITDGVTSLIITNGGLVGNADTITMPPNPVDGQVIEIILDHDQFSITVNANSGQSIRYATMGLTNGTTASWRYVLSTTTWYRLY